MIYECLIKVAGAMPGTPREVLYKELHLHRMEIFLYQTSLVQRAVRTVNEE